MTEVVENTMHNLNRQEPTTPVYGRGGEFPKLSRPGGDGGPGSAAHLTISTTLSPLLPGSSILQGRYHIVQLLHQRPRVNLYLAQRLPIETSSQQEPLGAPLIVPVAVRELVLTSLPSQEREQIEHAAFEEFVSPAMLGSPRLPGAGDRIRIEGDRHYLIMQLRRTRGERQTMAITLAELLLQRRQWPTWLTLNIALEWGIQLCRLVARLHRLGVVLGDLNLNTILVDSEGPAEWVPVLLIYWPPAPQFWPQSNNIPATEHYSHVFPAARTSLGSAFAAPETLRGKCNQRSDIYSLGALLYLLLTHYAPATATLRASTTHNSEAMELIPPHLFNSHIPTTLEKIVLRALSLDLLERYPSVFALVEALEAVGLEQAQNDATPMRHNPLTKL